MIAFHGTYNNINSQDRENSAYNKGFKNGLKKGKEETKEKCIKCKKKIIITSFKKGVCDRCIETILDVVIKL